LKIIQLEFFFPNTTSLVQAIDMGTITNVKALYHTNLVNYSLEAIQENLTDIISASNEVRARTDFLHAAQFIASSW
jgi:hypothetical protein